MARPKNYLWQPSEKQTRFLECPAFEALYGGAAGGGKAGHIDALVHTPFGPKRMGDIHVGDQVSNPHGGSAKVIAVHPQGVKALYKFTFDDGAQTETTLDHLWAVRIARVRRFRKKPVGTVETWRIATTAQIIEELKRGRRLLIPITQPVEFTVTARFKNGRWPVHPYVLGAFIGDGHIGQGSLSLVSADPPILAAVGSNFEAPSNIDVREGCQVNNYAVRNLKKFEKLGLRGHRAWEKFIPKQYLLAPLSMRWPLMRGLMDTDGYADSRGHASYTTTSEQLSKDVQWLARSLGFKANITSKIPTFHYKGIKKEGRLAYTVWIKGNDNSLLFSLDRKKERALQNYNGGFSERSRRIISVEYSRDAEAQCITVDNPNGLYITDDFIVTHNSDALLIAALSGVVHDGYRALILRRRLADLEKSLIYRSHLLYRGRGKYDGQRHRWSFPNNSYIEFGHVQHPADLYNYQSAEYATICVDELSQFLEDMYVFFFSRIRTTNPNIRCMIRSATNPGGVGHGWIKKRFWIDDAERPVNRSHPVEVEYINPDGETKKLTYTRAYIPATVYENPHIMQNDPGYIMRLATLPEHRRKALLDGRWDIFEGQFFTEWDTRVHVCQPFTIPQEWRRSISFDWGYSDHMAMYWFAEDPRSGVIYCYREFYVNRMNDLDVAKKMDEKTGDEKIHTIYYPWDIDTKHPETQVSIHERMDDATGHKFYWRKGNNDRKSGWAAFRYMLAKREDGHPRMKIFSNCVNLIRTIPEQVHETDGVNYGEDLDTLGDDHCVDGVRYFLSTFRNLQDQPKDKLEQPIDLGPAVMWPAKKLEDGTVRPKQFMFKKDEPQPSFKWMTE